MSLNKLQRQAVSNVGLKTDDGKVDQDNVRDLMGVSGQDHYRESVEDWEVSRDWRYTSVSRLW